MAAAKAKKRADQAHVKNLERALKEERLGLMCITAAFVKECPDPDALRRRLDRMVHLAHENPKVPQATKAAMRAGVQLVEAAIAVDMKKPQPLFDPNVGHTAPAKVEDIVDPPQVGAGQATLAPGGQGGLEALQHDADDQQAAHKAMQATVVSLFEAAPEGLSDGEMLLASGQPGVPYVPHDALVKVRKELLKMGRLANTGMRRNDQPVFDLAERIQ